MFNKQISRCQGRWGGWSSLPAPCPAPAHQQRGWRGWRGWRSGCTPSRCLLHAAGPGCTHSPGAASGCRRPPVPPAQRLQPSSSAGLRGSSRAAARHRDAQAASRLGTPQRASGSPSIHPHRAGTHFCWRDPHSGHAHCLGAACRPCALLSATPAHGPGHRHRAGRLPGGLTAPQISGSALLLLELS